ncbi:MAG: FkbM family methyltransferase [Caulobacterales bacterium]|nr:FkbM family methyltransferase [Caulobacterales bacterium]
MSPIELCAKFAVPMRGVLHVGANRGQEYADYAAATAGPILYVEAIPELAADLATRLDPARPHRVVTAVCAARTGDEVTFNVSSNDGLSSSLYPFSRHAEAYPTITYERSFKARTTSLDDLLAAAPDAAALNVLCLDVQGAERDVLEGAAKALERFDAVYAEIAETPLYEGGCTFADVHALLTAAGFHLRDLAMSQKLWGNAFYVRPGRTLMDELARAASRSLARGKLARQSSRYLDFGPELAVNGNVWQEVGCHTLREDRPWWTVDLGAPAPVRRVTILDRTRHRERGRTLLVEGGVEEGAMEVLFDRSAAGALDRVMVIPVGRPLRHLRCSLQESNYLHLAQIIVE